MKLLHEFGYAHGDLKMANICSRLKQNGRFKFTLIDLGVSMRLPLKGEITKNKKFRGNLLLASYDHIRNRRSGAVDDIYSLLCVAHLFIYGTLPWQAYWDELKSTHGKTKNQRRTFLKLRKEHKETFDEELCRNSQELNKIFIYVCKARKARNQIDRKKQAQMKVSSRSHDFDHDECLSLLPEIPELCQNDLKSNLQQSYE